MSDDYFILDRMESATGWSALSTDTTTVAISTASARGTNCVSFAKVNGAANTIFGGISRTIDVNNMDDHHFYPNAIIAWHLSVTATTNIAYSFLRLGSTAANYAEWRYDDSSLTAGKFTLCAARLGDCYVGGTGCDFDNMDYMAVGCAFDAETDALAAILVDHIYLDSASVVVNYTG